jgi:hypothetical protein
MKFNPKISSQYRFERFRRWEGHITNNIFKLRKAHKAHSGYQNDIVHFIN